MSFGNVFRSLLWLAAFAVTWLLLSGILKPITLYLGAASCLMVLFVFRRMEKLSPRGQLELRQRPIKLIGYLFWLMGEIIKSTWSVTKVILSPEMPIKQNLFKVPNTQKGAVATTVFANSITLTPGTVTVDVGKNFLWVHAVQYSEDDHEALADMDRRVTDVERAE